MFYSSRMQENKTTLEPLINNLDLGKNRDTDATET